MYSFIAGVIVGVAIATVGVSGVAKVMDKGVEVIKEQSRSLAQ